jgi:hypothetical protein
MVDAALLELVLGWCVANPHRNGTDVGNGGLLLQENPALAGYGTPSLLGQAPIIM